MAVPASETASATAGREGKATSPDGKINLNLSPPGSNGPGTNPEQLFGAGYSACFGGAIKAAAGLEKIALNANDIKVTATVNLNKDESGFFLDVTLNAELNGVDQARAEALLAKAHTICPYSKATRGNIEVSCRRTATRCNRRRKFQSTIFQISPSHSADSRTVTTPGSSTAKNRPPRSRRSACLPHCSRASRIGRPIGRRRRRLQRRSPLPRRVKRANPPRVVTMIVSIASSSDQVATCAARVSRCGAAGLLPRRRPPPTGGR